MMSFFFFNDTATAKIYTLSLHDALPIWRGRVRHAGRQATEHARREQHLVAGRERRQQARRHRQPQAEQEDRKSTRLNSSHANISYAVFCLKKKILCYTTITLPPYFSSLT